ncbi:MAG TPA: ATP-binding protein [Gemmatimonadales bacterium]
MGETRVDLLHLLEDLRDAYPGSLEETILTEIVANSLDSGATRVAFITDQPGAALTATDDGQGMNRRELRRYHDLATTSKRRGRGIGFAGVGIKLGLLVCETVLTESRTRETHVATLWHLKSRHKAPWKWVDPPGLVAEHGTAVRLALGNPLSELLDEAFIETALRRHFEPLFDPTFDAMLASAYPHGIAFHVNGRALERGPPAGERVAVAIKLPRKRKPAAAGYVFHAGATLAEAERGVAISTLGKVIKRGWDWLGMTPADADAIGGLIEAPALAECLTLNKADFIRTGPRGATYLAYRKAMQEALSEPLARWGETRESEETKRRRARPLERDLKKVLAELASAFPLLAALTDRRPGGQRRLPLGRDGGVEMGADALSPAPTPEVSVAGDTPGTTPEPAETQEPAAESPEPPPETKAALSAGGRPRRAHLGLRIDFDSRPDDPTLGRLVESTIWVNEAHPAYRRALASRSQGYHLALTVAMTLAPLAVEAAQVHEFVTVFLERWGEEL